MNTHPDNLFGLAEEIEELRRDLLFSSEERGIQDDLTGEPFAHFAKALGYLDQASQSAKLAGFALRRDQDAVVTVDEGIYRARCAGVMKSHTNGKDQMLKTLALFGVSKAMQVPVAKRSAFLIALEASV